MSSGQPENPRMGAYRANEDQPSPAHQPEVPGVLAGVCEPRWARMSVRPAVPKHVDVIRDLADYKEGKPMSLYICSLKRDTKQSIPPNIHVLLRFPFGTSESYDQHKMHQMAQPDGYQIKDWDTDDRSGLIWPAQSGWATITGVIYWSDGSATKYSDRISRDPLGFTPKPNDTTATEYRQAFDGVSPYHKTHEIFVQPGTAIGIQVSHNSPVSQTVYLAEFKLAIETNVAS